MSYVLDLGLYLECGVSTISVYITVCQILKNIWISDLPVAGPSSAMNVALNPLWMKYVLSESDLKRTLMYRPLERMSPGVEPQNLPLLKLLLYFPSRICT